VRDAIPSGHKVATQAMAEGDPVRKYAPDHWLCFVFYYSRRPCAYSQYGLFAILEAGL
jgi:hypothetical protein